MDSTETTETIKLATLLSIINYQFEQEMIVFKIKDLYNSVISQNQSVCLFVLRLNVPVNNFSVMSGRSHRFLGN